MFNSLKLLLPALIPSWRFFDVIAPAPYIEIAVYKYAHDEGPVWKEFRPRPDKLTILAMCKRMIWNPRWNESLFLMSCAERLAKDEEPFAREEIFRRIKSELTGKGYVQFRLVFKLREAGSITSHINYISAIEPFDVKTK